MFLERPQLTQLAIDWIFEELEKKEWNSFLIPTNCEKEDKSLGFVIRGYHRPVRALNNCLHCENRFSLSGESRAEEIVTLASFSLLFHLWLTKMRLIAAEAISFIFKTSQF